MDSPINPNTHDPSSKQPPDTATPPNGGSPTPPIDRQSDGQTGPESKPPAGSPAVPLVERPNDFPSVTVVDSKTYNTYLSSPLQQLINEYVGQHIDHIIKPWLGVLTLIASLIAAGTYIYNIGESARNENATNHAQKTALDKIDALGTKYENEQKIQQDQLNQKFSDIGALMRQAEADLVRVENAQHESDDLRTRYQSAEDDAQAAKHKLDAVSEGTERRYTALSSVLERMLQIIQANPGVEHALDLRGVQIGEVVVVRSDETKVFEDDHFNPEHSTWCRADGRLVPNSLYARSASDRGNVPDLSPLTDKFIQVYGTKLGSSINFYIRIN